MIKINLAKRKTSSLSGPESKKGSVRKIDWDEIKEFPILKLGLAIAICYLTDTFFEKEMRAKVFALNTLYNQINQEKVQLNRKLVQAKGFEKVKEELERDEFILKSKIDTIKNLIDDRGDSPKMLVSLSKSIPDNVWLEKVDIEEQDMSLSGGAMTLSQVSDFIRELNNTAYFSKVTLRKSQGSQTLGKTQFTVEAKRGR